MLPSGQEFDHLSEVGLQPQLQPIRKNTCDKAVCLLNSTIKKNFPSA